jgi:hypothetical protein
MGGAMPTLVERLNGVEQRRQALAKAIDAMPASPRLPRIEWPVLAREARRMLQQWRDLLHDDVGDTRQVLRELLEGPLQFTPIMMGRRGYRFDGALTIGGQLGGIAEVVRYGVPGRNWTQGHAGIWRIPFAGEVIIAHAA